MTEDWGAGLLCTLCGMYHDKVWPTMFGACCQQCFDNPPRIAIQIEDNPPTMRMKVIHEEN